jgi:hypothetical protein
MGSSDLQSVRARHKASCAEKPYGLASSLRENITLNNQRPHARTWSEAMTAKISEIVTMSMSELNALPYVCSWRGCRAAYRGDMPHGWVYLISYWSKRPHLFFCDIPQRDVSRDAHLCPAHTRELEGFLLDRGHVLLRGEPQGRA